MTKGNLCPTLVCWPSKVRVIAGFEGGVGDRQAMTRETDLDDHPEAENESCVAKPEAALIIA